jgi:hypothetical protein
MKRVLQRFDFHEILPAMVNLTLGKISPEFVFHKRLKMKNLILLDCVMGDSND